MKYQAMLAGKFSTIGLQVIRKSFVPIVGLLYGCANIIDLSQAVLKAEPTGD